MIYTTNIVTNKHFQEVENRMTNKRAIQILKTLPSAYFPYNKPEWGLECYQVDLDSYEICLAISRALEALQEKEEV